MCAGSVLAITQDVIVVSMQYRTGMLGFMYDVIKIENVSEKCSFLKIKSKIA